MARDVKNIKAPARKGRGKMMYHPPPLIDNTKIVTSEKAEVFYLFFASVFNRNLSSHISEASEPSRH